MPCLKDNEGFPELRAQISGRVAPHRQARADFGPIGGERPEDHRAAGLDCTSQRLDVPCSFPLVDQEMEDGAIVPQAVTPIRLPLEEIRLDTPHGRVRGKPSSGGVERHLRYVENRDVDEAARNELAGEERSPAADVDHGRVPRDPERLDELE